MVRRACDVEAELETLRGTGEASDHPPPHRHDGEADERAADEAFTLYLTALNRSPATIRSYLAGVERFLMHLRAQGHTSPVDATWQDIAAYQASLFACYARSSVMTHMNAIRALYGFLERRGDISRPPTEWVPSPRAQRRLPRDVLTPQEVAAILAAPNTATACGLFHRALLELTYSAALRRAEVCSLCVADVDTSSGTIAPLAGAATVPSHELARSRGLSADDWGTELVETSDGQVLRTTVLTVPEHGRYDRYSFSRTSNGVFRASRGRSICERSLLDETTLRHWQETGHPLGTKAGGRTGP